MGARTGLVAPVHIVSFKLGIDLLGNGQNSIKQILLTKSETQKGAKIYYRLGMDKAHTCIVLYTAVAIV